MPQTKLKLNVLNIILQILLVATYLYFAISLWDDVFKGSMIFFIFFAIIPLGDALTLLIISFINLFANRTFLTP